MLLLSGFVAISGAAVVDKSEEFDEVGVVDVLF